MTDPRQHQAHTEATTRQRPIVELPDAPAAGTPRAPATQPVKHGVRTAPRRPRAKGRPLKALDPEAKIRRKSSGLVRFLNGLMTLTLLLGLLIVGSGYYMHAALSAKGPLQESVTVAVPRNDSRQQIGERLERLGVVEDRRMFVLGLYALQIFSFVTGGKPIGLKAGEYEIRPGASIRAVIDVISEGRSVLVRVTIPEGLTSFQVVQRLRNEEALTGDVRAIPPEGSLLPETYSVPRGTTRQQFIELMQASQQRVLEQVWAQRQPDLPLATPQEALVLASIIEKETGHNDERRRVSGVFVNRLRQNMRLQSDPTILYGLYEGKVQWGKPILRSEIRSQTAYNTYVIPALPPGPICNPGRAALEAAVNPEQTNELFFVADGKGGHLFAVTNREHEANVRKWRQIEAEIRKREAEAPEAKPGVVQNQGTIVAPPSVPSQVVVPRKLNAGSASTPAKPAPSGARKTN